MTGGIVLAAGYSSRMGRFKPLLSVDGVPALVRAIRCLSGAGLSVAVVTGHRHEELSPLIAAEGAVELFNESYAEGMFGSVLTGVRYFARLGADAALLLPADCPLVPVSVVRELAALDTEDFAVPCWRGKKGHPLRIPARFFDEILSHDGSGGLKAVTLRHPLFRLETACEGVVTDMDVPEDYEALQRAGSEPSLAELAKGRRFFLLRHGATELHSGKIVMGRYDAKLSDLGREQMETVGRALAGCRLNISTVYTTPLSRALESANIVDAALRAGVTVVEDLQELSLGAWDGMLIEDVKRRWPEEYARRGAELMSYKFDAESESFYDLQYRSVRALKKLLMTDGSPDILIVSHAGVLKCLYGNLMGESIDWAFDRFKPEKGELTLLPL